MYRYAKLKTCCSEMFSFWRPVTVCLLLVSMILALPSVGSAQSSPPVISALTANRFVAFFGRTFAVGEAVGDSLKS